MDIYLSQLGNKESRVVRNFQADTLSLRELRNGTKALKRQVPTEFYGPSWKHLSARDFLNSQVGLIKYQ